MDEHQPNDVISPNPQPNDSSSESATPPPAEAEQCGSAVVRDVVDRKAVTIPLLVLTEYVISFIEAGTAN